MLSLKAKTFCSQKGFCESGCRAFSSDGIRVNMEKAEVILDFLYLVAKTYNTQKGHNDCRELEPTR
ncbi:hypothetical protein DXN05_01510 [Deminuibacter soli]|uniref:Uncharacterized protein n=1 Tax=Deminuibacter soli TaxID=2291815 RepID=A0A3E1NP22_9BACT|nr:hypothetical protein DXN05_01510 [Deminuibacter soli]